MRRERERSRAWEPAFSRAVNGGLSSGSRAWTGAQPRCSASQVRAPTTSGPVSPSHSFLALSKYRWVEIVRGAPELAAATVISHIELCVAKMSPHPTRAHVRVYFLPERPSNRSSCVCFVTRRCGCG